MSITHVLTEKRILEEFCEDHKDPSEITDLECIFSGVQLLGGFDNFVRLQSLRLMNTGLVRISRLEPLGATLTHLTLSAQLIDTIPPLPLPNIRELYLHDNRILKIEGLSQCVRLEKLWLCSNRIRKIGGLESQGSLRELWLQGNLISSIESGVLKHNPNLEILAMGKNNIANLKDVSRLVSNLPLLHNLSFSDPNFGECPVVHVPEYRNFVLTQCESLETLDDIEIMKQERSFAETSFVRQIRKFNRKLDDLADQSEQEILKIEAEKQRRISNTRDIRRDIANEFQSLDQIIAEGEVRMNEEIVRQERLALTHRKNLETELKKMKEEYEEEIERLVRKEERELLRTDRGYEDALKRAEMELQDATMMKNISQSGHVLARYLDSESSEFKICQARIEEKTHRTKRSRKNDDDDDDDKRRNIKTIHIYRLHGQDDVEDKFNVNSSRITTMRMYLPISDVKSIRQVIERTRKGSVVLYSDPCRALESQDVVFRLLECVVAIQPHTHTHFGTSCLNEKDVAKLITELPSNSSGQASFSSYDSSSSSSSSSRSDEKCEDIDTVVFFKSFPSSCEVIRPTYYFGLFDSSSVISLEKILSTFVPDFYVNDDDGKEKTNRLLEIESKARNLVARSEKQYWTEINPRLAKRMYRKKKNVKKSNNTSVCTTATCEDMKSSENVVVSSKKNESGTRRSRLSSMKRRELARSISAAVPYRQ